MVHQFYQTRVIDEFVLRGNTATLKCLIPSFVADFVQVVEWVTDDDSFSATPISNTNYGNKIVLPFSVWDNFILFSQANTLLTKFSFHYRQGLENSHFNELMVDINGIGFCFSGKPVL